MTMKLEFHDDPEVLVTYGEYPPVEQWDAQVEHRDAVARAVAEHPSNGFQYGIDISAGNVDCVMVKRIKGKPPLILVADPETGDYPEGAEPATICRYDSWR
jgi:hypothetical protein